jgi:molybdate transport system substrate-binding protein
MRNAWRLLALVLVAAGCDGGSAEVKPAPAAAPATSAAIELHVAAASDLQAALPPLAARFTTRTGIKITPTFDASGVLAEQIRQGAPFDVFLAANESFVKKLADDGTVVADSVRPYALGSLVIVVNRKSGVAVASIADLAKPEIKKIALANPKTAPYGAAGKQALERSKLWDSLEKKIVVASSVRQTLQFVQTGNAEVGLVGRAIANAPEVSTVDVDRALYDPIVQGLGIVARSKQLDAARAFTGFITGSEGHEVLGTFGFSIPKP